MEHQLCYKYVRERHTYRKAIQEACVYWDHSFITNSDTRWYEHETRARGILSQPRRITQFFFNLLAETKRRVVLGQCFRFRLHRIREMQTIVTDDRGVCPSASLSVTRLKSASLRNNDWTDQDAVWGEDSWGPWSIVLDVGPDLPQRGEGDPLLNFGTPLYLRNSFS